MSHRINRDLYKALESSALIQKVATGETISVGGLQLGVVRDFGAGTFGLPTLDADSGRGCILLIVADGAQTWQNATPTTLLTLGSGEVGLLVSIGSTSPYWRAINIDGSLSDDLTTVLGTHGVTIATAAGAIENSETSETTIEGTILELQNLEIVMPFTKFTTTAAASPLTASAGNLTGARHVFFQVTTDGAFGLTQRTATQMFGDITGCYVGFSFLLTVVNRGDNTLTITAGGGVTTTGELTLATLVTRTYVCTFTSATAMTMVSVSKGTIET
jgi:hypothetical protein